MTRINCIEELHPAGGPGRFVLSRAEDFLSDQAEPYWGKVQLIYLDPPFGTGDTFRVRVQTTRRTVSVPVYADTKTGEDYVAWMREILMGCHRLLRSDGSIYLHVDYRMSAKMRILLDEIFGEKNFMDEIVWAYRSGGRSTRYFPRKHDTILFYRKTRNVYFNISAVGKPRGPEKRNHMKRFVDDAGRVCFSIKTGGKTYVYTEDMPAYPTDVWADIEHLQQKDPERSGYATQKPEALLDRIICASSRPGDLVCDLFSGSGTTASVAAKRGRAFLAVDASPIAMNCLRRRLIRNAQATDLFAENQPFSLVYPAGENEPKLQYSVVTKDRRPWLRLSSVDFGRGYALAYAAVGTVGACRFEPHATSFVPKLPLYLPLDDLKSPVLCVSDGLGRQAFVGIEPSDPSESNEDKP